jgi:superfamily II DNA or RNA helicase
VSLRPYQTQCIENILKAKERGVKRQLVSMATGTGKCHAPGTPILLHNGYIKLVENVVVGDLLMGPDSSPRTVLSLSHGTEEMFDVIPVKGDTYTVNRSHILAIKQTRKIKSGKEKYISLSVDAYLGKTKYFKHRAKTYRVGVEFDYKTTPVDPYYIGVWLGDGHSNSTSVTCEDFELIDYLKELSTSLGLEYGSRWFKTPHCPTHTITSGIGAAKNPLLEVLRSLDLIKNKHIPDVFKLNSREVRLQVLAGLVDTDGYHDGTGTFEISSVFPKLADDILFLARSLGFAAYRNIGPKSSQLGTIGTYHRITISGDIEQVPTKILRKQAGPRSQKKDVLCSGIKVKSKGVGEYFGFEIDGDHLYLMGDFTVTHNSLIFGNIPQYAPKGKRTLLTVHTKELVEQAAKHLAKWNPGLSVGIEMADQVTSGEQIVVASIQTIGRETTNRRDKFDPKDFAWVIVDECHRSISETYTNVFEHFGLYNSAYDCTLLGVTATPKRGDGLAMGAVYEEIVYSYSIQDAIRDGWLSDVRGYRVKTTTDLSRVGSVAGDFKQDELSDTVNTPVRNQQIVEAWVREASTRQTVGFTVTVQHAKDLAYEFQKAGVPAMAIWGSDPDRAHKLAQHKSGYLKVLLCAQLLVEGYDDPNVSCIIMARPTRSSTFFIQAAGRGTRLDPNIDNLVLARAEGRIKAGFKVDMLLLDVVDATSKHSLVTLPTLFGLGSNLDLKGTSVLEAAKAIAAAQAKYPELDMSKLEDITKLKTFTEEVSLFRVDFCSEITEASQLQWHKRGHNSYRLLLPAKEQIVINGDALGLYTVTGQVVGQKVMGTGFKDLPEALAYAEKHLSTHGRSMLTLLRRESKWNKDPLTEGQLKMLKQFKVPPSVYMTWNKGDAARWITKKLGARR